MRVPCSGDAAQVPRNRPDPIGPFPPVRQFQRHAAVGTSLESVVPLRQFLAGNLAVGLDGCDHVPPLLANPFHQLRGGVPRIEQHVHRMTLGERRKELLQHLLRQVQLAVVAQLVLRAATVEPPDGCGTHIQTPQQREMILPPMNTQDDVIAAPHDPPLIMVKMPINALELACTLVLGG